MQPTSRIKYLVWDLPRCADNWPLTPHGNSCSLGTGPQLKNDQNEVAQDAWEENEILPHHHVEWFILIMVVSYWHH